MIGAMKIEIKKAGAILPALFALCVILPPPT
jgi:hypothetical protein